MVRALLTAVLSAAMSLVAVGCADDAGDGALRIIRNQYVEETTCVIAGAVTGTARSTGAIEVTSPIDYQLTPVVVNYATSASGKLISQRTAFLEGARVDLSFTKADLFTAAELTQMQTDGITKFSSPFSSTVPPDSSAAGMVFSIIPVELLDKIEPKLTAALPSVTVTARLRVFGQMGGGEVESESFFFPVTVCDFRKGPCLIGSVAATCAGTATPRKGNPCNPYQDGAVDCCMNGANVICPAPTSAIATGTAAQAEPQGD
jgi:hypothetical protein